MRIYLLYVYIRRLPMRRILLALSISLICPIALGAPAVTSASISGTTNSIVITGTGFGGTNPMMFWDDVSDAFSVSNLKSGDVVPASSTTKWGENTNIYGEPITFLQTDKTRSRKTEAIYYGAGHKSFLGVPKYTGTATVYDTMYVSWWYKPSISPSAEGGSNKFLRIWDDANGGGTRISWTQMHLTCGDAVFWKDWTGKVGEWNHHEFYVNLAQKKVVSKINGKVQHDVACEKSPNFPAKPIFLALVGFDHGMSAYQTMKTSMDDIYVSNSPARVVISESPTWNTAIETEILPIKTWATDKIEAGFVSGNIRLSGNIYLYVVDQTGGVNATGYKVKCPTCPVMK
ncbi:MAG: hypothetical protein EOO07_07925 [Chitinophagaceae bacterium]|nr:MAG: hypothetical protein EOO07_07925 [Chitinophagaceae bacterium]